MYDRRVADWITISPYLFPAVFDDSIIIEIQVNPEFGTADDAKIQAEKFAPIIGRLTTELRKDVETVWIHRGMKPFGGGNNNLLIHTDYSSENYEKQGILEETLVHEAAHTSLDAYHATDNNWIQAQEDDCRFISDYAEEHPTREDIADFQDEQEKLYEKVDEILSAQGNNCNGEDNVVKWSGGCVTWSGGYQQDGEISDNFVRYGS